MTNFTEDSYMAYKEDGSMTFQEWLKRYRGRDSNIGDFAYDAGRDKHFPIHASKEGQVFYLRLKSAHPDAISTCLEAHRGYSSYLVNRFNRAVDRENELLRIENAHLKRLLDGERF